MTDPDTTLTAGREGVASRALLGGFVRVPIRDSSFGEFLDLDSCIPRDCDVIMVLINSRSGLNAGWPKPIGFLRLPHQLYVEDIRKLLLDQAKEADIARLFTNGTRWVTVIPMRSKDYVDVWSVDGPPNDQGRATQPNDEIEGCAAPPCGITHQGVWIKRLEEKSRQVCELLEKYEPETASGEWICDLENGSWDHDWITRHDSAGEVDGISGQDWTWRECRACGITEAEFLKQNA